jgi:hypothetical protein
MSKTNKLFKITNWEVIMFVHVPITLGGQYWDDREKTNMLVQVNYIIINKHELFRGDSSFFCFSSQFVYI